MTSAEAQERYRKLLIVWESLLRDLEKKHGARLLFNPVRFETQGEAFKRKIEEEQGCAS